MTARVDRSHQPPQAKVAHSPKAASGPKPIVVVGEDEATADTRQRLIETAARHFAEFGFEAASLRAIQRELGVNPASVHYHFGSKRAVYEAIMDSYLARVQAERSARLEAIDGKLRGRARLEALLRAYTAPHLEVVAQEQGEAYGRLMARGVIEPHGTGPDVVMVLQPLRERFLSEVGRLFPDAGRSTIARCLSFAIILMATVPFDRSYAAMTGRKPRGESAKAWIEAVNIYATAGFMASCGELLE